MKAIRRIFFALVGTLPSVTISATIRPLFGQKNAGVAMQSAQLIDITRIDPFAGDGRARTVMVSSFYPVTRCTQKEVSSYMPPGTASFMDEKFSAYGLPNGSFRSLSIENCVNNPNDRSNLKATPLVVFSGALGTSRHLYNALLQNVAANGYLVVSIDHPYDADIVEFSNGSIVHSVNIDDKDLGRALEVRVKDIAFLYRQLSNTSVTNQLFPGRLNHASLQNTAIFGHSFGGAAAVSSMLDLPFLKGGLNLDGTMFGRVLNAGLDRPLMLVGHENKTRATDPSWNAIWPRLRAWHKEYEVRKTAHYSFSDLPLVLSTLGLQGLLPPQVGELLGTIDGERMMKLTTSYVTAFLDMVLKSHNEKQLRAADREFPEAQVVC